MTQEEFEEPAPDKSYWKSAVIRRVRVLVEELERIDPDDLEILRQTPQFALLREWVGQRSRQEYDL